MQRQRSNDDDNPVADRLTSAIHVRLDGGRPLDEPVGHQQEQHERGGDRPDHRPEDRDAADVGDWAHHFGVPLGSRGIERTHARAHAGKDASERRRKREADEEEPEDDSKHVLG